MVSALRGTHGWLVALVLASASCSTVDPGAGGAGGGGQAPVGGSPGTAGTAATMPLGGTGGAPSGGSGPAGGGGSGAGGTGAVPSAGTGGATPVGGSGTTGGTAGTTGAGGNVSMPVSDLPLPPGAGGAPKPSGAAGGLKVLDWAGFKAAVSYTFDDSNSSQISRYSDLQALGVRFTFYLQTGKSESSNMVWAQAVKDGHELGNHTKSHSSNATGEDVDAATKFIEDTFKVKVWTMAAPNGAAGYTDVAKTRFLINRGVANGLVGPNDNTDPFTLFCYIPPTGASQAALDAQVTDARTAGKWRVVLVHGFTGGTDGAYQPVSFENFNASVKASKALGDVWIDSVVNVGAYWRGQKAFSLATPVTSGTTQTWTWKLPDHFPPGKFLRVSVTGGNLTQKGAALPWNDHGFYEVALDALSLTLSP